jgi:hypothetical protein
MYITSVNAKSKTVHKVKETITEHYTQWYVTSCGLKIYVNDTDWSVMDESDLDGWKLCGNCAKFQ